MSLGIALVQEGLGVSWKASKEMHGSFGPQSRGTSKSISLKKDRRSGRRKEKGALIFVPRGDGALPHPFALAV